MRYDRGRGSQLDRHATYIVSTSLPAPAADHRRGVAGDNMIAHDCAAQPIHTALPAAGSGTVRCWCN